MQNYGFILKLQTKGRKNYFFFERIVNFVFEREIKKWVFIIWEEKLKVKWKGKTERPQIKKEKKKTLL